MIDGLKSGAPAFLASVTSDVEALLALSCGADVIDCKDPAKGALGALDETVIASVVAAVAGRVLVSATIGDLPIDANRMVEAARAVAATGADLVKIGFFGGADPRAAIEALARADVGRARLVAVLMADLVPDCSLVPLLAKARFAGVMLDTADKSSGALPDVLATATIVKFITLVRENGMSVGVAGKLRLQHIAGLIALQPDVIGFRGALCHGGRTSALDPVRVRAVRGRIDDAVAVARSSKRFVA